MNPNQKLRDALFALADPLEQLLVQARKRVDKLTPSLLARAFAGQIVPQNPEDEPAQKLLERFNSNQESKSHKASKDSRGLYHGVVGAVFYTLLLTWGVGVAAANTNLAPAIDLRPAFQKWGLPLRAQGNRGTCSVFAMTGALEFALASRHQTGTVLSVEFLNWASNQATTNSKDGGFFADLWTGFAVYGICQESILPYRENYDPNLRPRESVRRRAKAAAEAHLLLHWIKPWNVATGLTETQFLEIKRTLSLWWPVCGGFRWPKQAVWNQDVLQMVPPTEVFDGHSVLLVGFRDDPVQPGGGVLLICNSGAGPPEAAVPYDYARAYLNDAAWIAPARGKEP